MFIFKDLTCPYGANVARRGHKATKMGIADIPKLFADVSAVGAHIDRPRYGLLIDTRAAPMNNHDDFEGAMRAHIAAHTAGYRRRAVLVATAAGVLQVSRTGRDLANDGGVAPTIFRDEAEAMAFLSAP